jgi:hypothetical protein
MSQIIVAVATHKPYKMPDEPIYLLLVYYRRLLGSADKAEQHQKDPYEKLVDGPEYLPAWDNLMKPTRVHAFNMFVMPASMFDAYCAWLFPLLDLLREQIDASNMGSFAARWPGRVSERTLDPWLVTNGISYSELPVVSPEPVDWVKKGSSFLAAKFFGKKYEGSF